MLASTHVVLTRAERSPSDVGRGMLSLGVRMVVPDATATVRVEVLGPLRVFVDGTPVDVRGTKRRAVLVLLALARGRTVTVDRLLDALWPSEVPESGRQALHSHVSRLRGQLGAAAGRLQTRQDGYLLGLADAELDVAEARSLLAAARADTTADPAGAFTRLLQAHALWRGPVLADLVDVGPVAAAVEECARLHREVTDALIGTGIATGQADAVVGLAASSFDEDPLREPAVMLLMRALAASGQAPEALRVGRSYRRRLAEQAGLDPSPTLGALEREIAGGAAGPEPPHHEVVPRPATRLVGREAQVAALHRLLSSERLVTVVGTGGVGKTRLALTLAQQSGAATVLPLAPVTEPAAIPHALAAALGLNVVQGDVRSACFALLGDRPGLLLVDNCEHLLDAVRDTVDAALSACPGLSVLATSREPLGLADEHTFRLAPLPVPGPGQDAARVASVALFLDRAAKVRPELSPTPAELRTVAAIVHRLDGVPLAIELAAGRLSTFSLEDLRDRLDRALDLLGGGRPSGDRRHRTLRTTLDWSYRLLTDDERRLFRHLAVFPDGVDLPTAERIAADLGLDSDPGSVLARLVDASMIDPEFESGTRYRMLHTLRAFGLDRLAAEGEEDEAAGRFLRWAVGLTSWICAAMSTDDEPHADAVLRREMPGLRAAWRLARERKDLDAATTMVTALFDSIAYRDLVEIRDWAEELAADPAVPRHPRAASVLGAAAEAVYHRGDYARAERMARAGLERAGGEGAPWQCLMALSVAALARGAYSETVEHALAGAAITGPSREGLGIAALAMAYAGDSERARELNRQGLAAAVSPSMRAWGEYVAGEIENLTGHNKPAEQRYLRAMEQARTSGATFLAGVATVGLLTVQAAAGRVQEALAGYRDVIEYFARTGNWTHQWATLRNLAGLLRRLGDHEPAELLHAAADAAPDAPAAGPAPGAGPRRRGPITNRADILDVAREAIRRNLAQAGHGVDAQRTEYRTRP